MGVYDEASEGPQHPQGPLMMVGVLIVMGLVVPWYLSSGEPALAEVVQHMNVALMLLPVLLLCALKLLSTSNNNGGPYNNSSSWAILSPSFDQPSQVHEVGGSPWGISIFLAIILFMIWYQSAFQQSWHPIVRS